MAFFLQAGGGVAAIFCRRLKKDYNTTHVTSLQQI